MKRLALLLLLAGCGGNSTPGTCTSTPCGTLGQSYELCESGTQITYKFGSMSCSFSSSDAAGATTCEQKLQTWCPASPKPGLDS